MIHDVILPRSPFSVHGIQYYLNATCIAFIKDSKFLDESLCGSSNSIRYELIADVGICRESEIINFAAVVEKTFRMGVRAPARWWIVLSP